MPVRTKRWNDPISPDDGYRLLICRYRPRGVKKRDEPWDAWCAALGPSKELHALAYGKTGAPPLAWDAYARRFRDEMRARSYFIAGYAQRIREGETVTLLCSSACEEASRCHRSIVAALIEAAAFPERASKGPVMRVALTERAGDREQERPRQRSAFE